MITYPWNHCLPVGILYPWASPASSPCSHSLQRFSWSAVIFRILDTISDQFHYFNRIQLRGRDARYKIVYQIQRSDGLMTRKTHRRSLLVQCLSDAWQHQSCLKILLSLQSTESFSLFLEWVPSKTVCPSSAFASTDVEFLPEHMNAIQVIRQPREEEQINSRHTLWE